MKHKVICLLSIITIVSCFFFMPIVQAETLQEKKEETEKKQEEAEKQLEYVQEELSTSLLKIQELDEKIKNAESEIAQMNEKIAKIDAEVKKTTEVLNVVEKEYEANRTLMEKRMVVMYECGDISYLDLLLHSSSIVEFLSNYYVIEQIMESDNLTLEEIEKQKNEIETTKEKLEKDKTEAKTNKNNNAK